MTVDIVTKADLDAFRMRLLNDLKHFIQPQVIQHKEWLRSAEVKKILNISSVALNRLRVNGTLGSARIGTIILYKYEDLEKLLNNASSTRTPEI